MGSSIGMLIILNLYRRARPASMPALIATNSAQNTEVSIVPCRFDNQKLNTRSSTEAVLVAVDDVSNMILWTRLFLDEQGYRVSRDVVHQDNKSAILLETNGKKTSSKRTRAINIRYFFIADQVKKGNVEIRYCPTNMMIGDFFTKPLHGKNFEYFRDLILGKKSVSSMAIDAKRVLTDENSNPYNEQTNVQPEM
jgi:hypothetical protein